MDIVPQSPYERLEPLRNSWQKRFGTFQGKWPSHAPVTAKDLADDYFYYIGYEDKVQCTHCGGILSGWCMGDVVTVEHAKHFPHCPWVAERQRRAHQQQLSPNLADSQVPRSDGRSGFNFAFHGDNLRYQQTYNSHDMPGRNRAKFQEYAVESTRLSTYRGWPSQMKQTPEILTKSGFFYLGEGDKVKCFYCGGILWDWEEGDDPWEEHAKWFPDCPWLKMAKGDNYINRIQQVSFIHAYEKLLPKHVMSNNFGCLIRRYLLSLVLIEQTSAKVGASEATSVKTVDSNESASTSRVCQPSDAKSTPTAPKSPKSPSNAAGITSIGALTDKEKVDVVALVRENENLKSTTSCKVCLDADVGVVFLPCGHICCCASCAAPLQQCPICRKTIDKAVKAFLS
ncbi:hypothetical protein FSP39_017542 [Pinctada imbricata]|uniref:RING-type domain-containing protein n=1 Tax=Pinctada imbricata TaxID=66713 RepID=A0AA88Y5B8_PINIB|nr:hypothetical protein FSP39_017542 [Pinctada imbricata]